MISYPFNSITINGRIVEITNILSNTITPQSQFEVHTYSFIRDWLNSVDDFTTSTSGSTGIPKQIKITRKQMVHSASLTIQALGLKENSTAIICLNTNYIGGKMMLVRALEGNMKLIVIEPSLNPLINILQPFDFIALVPLQLQAILNSTDKEKLDKASSIIVGGALINEDLKKNIKDIHAPVYATYGMTETVSHIALKRLNGIHDEPYFTTLPNIKIKSDERGCLIVDAPYLGEMIYTNDLVSVISEEKFLWLGRWDNIINTGGVKVVPEKIESEIQKINDYKIINQKFLVSGVKDTLLGEKVIIIVEGEINESWKSILLSLKQTCSRYELPKEIRNVSKFNYTNNGKIDRKLTVKQMLGTAF